MTFQRVAIQLINDLANHTQDCEECRLCGQSFPVDPLHFRLLGQMMQSSFRLNVNEWQWLSNDHEQLGDFLDCAVSYFAVMRDTIARS